ncbi:hypothetical protein [Bacillus marasmi]|uniref:hypothetical protein n=1 Tax=Bacillus marasmi TaxID=1926279 RepID=UPI0011CB25E4|nr:hypothetical protein [Bacillus marasmi]
MDTKELSDMRLKQVAVTNGLMLGGIIILFFITKIFTIPFANFFLVLGILVLFQGVFGLIRGNSTNSLIPIFEKVAIYEKQKMGSEWYKQRKSGYIMNLLFSGLMFLQFYWNRHSPDNILEIEPVFMFIMTIIILVIINTNLIIHFRKVDRSTSETDLKGYTWRSNLIAVAIGIAFGLIMFVITIYYIISG